MADALDLGSSVFNGVRVRIPSLAPKEALYVYCYWHCCSILLRWQGHSRSQGEMTIKYFVGKI